MKTLAPAGLSTALIRAAQQVEAAATAGQAISAVADQEIGADRRLTWLGDSVQLEAVFADVTRDEVEQALDAAGINWRGDSHTPALNIIEIETAAGTLRTFLSGYFPAEKLMSLDSLLTDAGVGGHFIQANEGGFATGVGATTSQGDAAQLSDDARTNHSVDGSGITVGVISDSHSFHLGADGTTPTITTTADDIASGDLPANGVNVILEGSALSSDGDEGRAMAQIVHDVAPGADIAFHTSRGGQSVFASGITALANAGADVIVDDIIYFAEPIFQDGVIAQAATAFYNAGGVYLSSAGNNGNDGFLDTYRDSGVDGSTITALSGQNNGNPLGNLHDWNSDAGTFSPYLQVTVLAGDDFDLSFQWDEPFASAGGAGATSDLDIFVTEVTDVGLATESETLVDSGFSNNIGADAIEVVGVTADDTTAKTYRIYITQFDPPDTVAANLLAGVFFGASGFFETDYAPRILGAGGSFVTAPQVGSPTVFGHSNATGALAVGASAWFNTPEFNAGLTSARLNSFSSQGGYDILFDAAGNRLATPDVRDGVDFVAPDGGNTTFFGSDSSSDADSFPNFFGTSAAAPHAAGVAALLLQSVTTLTPDEVEQVLEGSGNAITQKSTGAAVDSSWTGTGLIDADSALAAAQLLRTNADPTAQDDAFEIDEDNGLVGGGNVLSDNGGGVDADADGDTLTIIEVNGNAALVGQPVALTGDATAQIASDGSLTVSSGTAYQGLQLGQTAQETIGYTVSDGNGGTATATVTITIQGVNDAPIAANDTAALDEDAASALIGNVLDGTLGGADTDVDHASLTVSSVSGDANNVGTGIILASGLSVQIDANGDVTAGSTPALDSLAAGASVIETITYTASDAAGASATATVEITVTGTNDAPVAVNDRALTEAAAAIASIGLLANDSDVDTGDSFSLTSLDTTGTQGLVTDNGDGTVSYDPNGAFAGLAAGTSAEDSFSYTVTDSQGATSTATVTVVILEQNSSPVAVADAVNAAENATGVLISPLANDTDADIVLGDFLAVQSVDTAGLLGTLTDNGDGTFSYSAGAAFDSLAAGGAASDSFTYTAVDGFGATSSQTVTITVQGENDAPVVLDDQTTTDEVSTLAVIDVLTNDTDVDLGDNISLLSFDTTGTLGTVTDNGDGTFSYDPGNAFRGLTSAQSGTDSFTYTATDDLGATATGTVTIQISGVDNLAAIDDSSDAAVGATTLIDVLANDSSPLGGTPFIAGFSTAGTLGRIVGFGPTGFSYEAPANLVNLVAGARIADSFSYTIGDSTIDQQSATVAVSIVGTKVATAGNDTIFGTQGDESISGGDGDDLLFGDEEMDVAALLASLGLGGGAAGNAAAPFTAGEPLAASQASPEPVRFILAENEEATPDAAELALEMAVADHFHLA